MCKIIELHPQKSKVVLCHRCDKPCSDNPTIRPYCSVECEQMDFYEEDDWDYGYNDNETQGNSDTEPPMKIK